jgi:hypothetical protein
LLPKVPTVPSVVQLRPITLLSVEYKILTKMLVARLLHVLPSVLRATQLCSVRGRSIFDGAAAILSAAEYLHRRGVPGFLLSLDFYHAYDRVSPGWTASSRPWALGPSSASGWLPYTGRPRLASCSIPCRLICL